MTLLSSNLPAGKRRNPKSPHGIPCGNLVVTDLTELTLGTSLDCQSPFSTEASYISMYDELYRSLHRSVPRHTLLIRERGVGEHAILTELALRASAGTPAFLRTAQILLTDWRQVANRDLSAAIAWLATWAKDATNAICCCDGLGRFLATSDADVRTLLYSWISNVPHRLILVLSPSEQQEIIDGNVELREMFTKVTVPEPTAHVAVELVQRVASGLEAVYGLAIDAEAVSRAVMLTDQFMLLERLPAKAIRVLQAVCDDVMYDRSERNLHRERVTEHDVLTKVAAVTGISVHTLVGVGDGVDYREVIETLILGQDHAVDQVAAELGLIKAGMRDDGKPASVMLFVGQTGTGKTEMAKVIARVYAGSSRIRTFTLGNFVESHSVSGIVGVPAGYVGHDAGGRLINELVADPNGVFLLDEADKAHPDVLQPFLNLFDEGWICDQRGVRARADRAMFILTTNVGQRQIAEMWRSGKSAEEVTRRIKELLPRIRHPKASRPVFSPEFLARVNRVVVFRSLDRSAMGGIVHRLLSARQSEWMARRHKRLQVEDEVLDLVAEQSHAANELAEGREGGRIVRKFFTDLVDVRVHAAIRSNPSLYHSAGSVVVRRAKPVDRNEGSEVTVSFES